MDRVVTVILHKDGRHHLTLTTCSREDAERWAESGYHVFLIAARTSKLWAVNHINTGRVFTSEDETPTHPSEVQQLLLKGDRQ
jgi:hypothetical protein